MFLAEKLSFQQIDRLTEFLGETLLEKCDHRTFCRKIILLKLLQKDKVTKFSVETCLINKLNPKLCNHRKFCPENKC